MQDSLPDLGTGVEDRVDRIALQEVLLCLPMMEAELIRLRYFKNLTQSQTGQLLGMSQVQVSRLEKKVLAKLRKEMTQE